MDDGRGPSPPVRDPSLPTETSPGSDGPDRHPPGQQWAEFHLSRELGRGGFGRVYAAWDPGLANDVALKIVALKDPSRLSSVMREGQMIARVRHPNVVIVHGVRQVGDEVGFVMELIRGESLADVVRRQGPMGWEEAAVIGRTLCQALAAVHQKNLLHRDLKAQNVMRESGGRIVLMDFGIARELPRVQPSNDLTGTPVYLAPELFGGASASVASDIYSLGVLLYFLVTGAYPIEGQTMLDLVAAHRSRASRRLIDRRPDLPPEFVRVVEGALSPAAADRYQSAGEMHRALDQIFGAIAGVNPPVPAPTPRPSPYRPWLIAAVALPICVAFFGFLSTRVYDTKFGVGDLADESPLSWVKYGVLVMLPPAALTLIFLVLWAIGRTVWQLLRPAVPPLDRLSSRAKQTLSDSVGRHMPRDLKTLGRWLLVIQVVATVALAVIFRQLFVVLLYPLRDIGPDLWNALTPNWDRGSLPTHYLEASVITIALMVIGWRSLLRQPGAWMQVDRSVIAAGLAVIALVVLALLAPYRLFFLSNHLPAFEVEGGRCYQTARRGDDLMLFCPDASSADKRIRPWRFSSDLKTLDPGSPFSPAK